MSHRMLIEDWLTSIRTIPPKIKRLNGKSDES